LTVPDYKRYGVYGGSLLKRSSAQAEDKMVKDFEQKILNGMPVSDSFTMLLQALCPEAKMLRSLI
jgi:hypothetical protein